MDWVAHRYINSQRYRGLIDLPARIRAFMDEDASRAAIVARKERDGIAYEAEVDRLAQADLTSTDQALTDQGTPACLEASAAGLYRMICRA